MRKRNEFTKQAARLALAYNSAKYADLREAYPSGYSDAKYNAEKAIWFEMLDNKGHGYRITGKNCFHFTCAYVYPDGKTGELRIRTHTASTWFDTPCMDTKTALSILNA